MQDIVTFTIKQKSFKKNRTIRYRCATRSPIYECKQLRCETQGSYILFHVKIAFNVDLILKLIKGSLFEFHHLYTFLVSPPMKPCRPLYTYKHYYKSAQVGLSEETWLPGQRISLDLYGVTCQRFALFLTIICLALWLIHSLRSVDMLKVFLSSLLL